MRLLLFCLLVCLFSFSCNIINPDEQVPAYLEMDAFSLSTSVQQGTNSQKITDLWTYTNSNSVGVYDLPAEVPVLNGGPTNIRILAGIKNNGISSTRINYPFYSPYDTVIDLKEGEHYQIHPRFAYNSGIDFDITRNFETGNFFQSMPGNSGTFNIVTNLAQVFEGTRSGILSLDGGTGKIYYKDGTAFELVSGNTIFLELNYSSNNRFNIGLISNSSSSVDAHLAVSINPTAGVNATEPVWNKIYIDLGLIAQQNSSADNFEIYLESAPLESQNIRLFLDNIKLVMWEQ
jgi:hypothetical protein